MSTSDVTFTEAIEEPVPTLNDRQVPHVTHPRTVPLPTSELFLPNGNVHIKNLRDQFFHEGKLLKEDVLILLERAEKLFEVEPNVVRVKSPITICGDIHGQFYDLLTLFDIGGNPEETTYLFLGDYVDRGNFSCEVLLLLYAYKINLPNSFFMLRGNHECRHLSACFTLKDECVVKYDLDVYQRMCKTFDYLPLAAIMDNQFFCVHGGISPSIKTVISFPFPFYEGEEVLTVTPD